MFTPRPLRYLDLAEHVPGTPFKYGHGWVKIIGGGAESEDLQTHDTKTHRYTRAQSGGVIHLFTNTKDGDGRVTADGTHRTFGSEKALNKAVASHKKSVEKRMRGASKSRTPKFLLRPAAISLSTIDLAIKPGQRYTHGWKPVIDEPRSLRLVRDIKAAQKVSVDEGLRDKEHQETQIRNNEILDWSRKLYHPHVLFARDPNGKIIGHLIYEHNKGAKNVQITDMRVDPAGRGAGVGAALVEHAKKVAREKKAKLSVYNMLQSARGFYAKTGASMVDWSAIGEWDLSYTLKPASYLDLAAAAGEHKYRHGWILNSMVDNLFEQMKGVGKEDGGFTHDVKNNKALEHGYSVAQSEHGRVIRNAKIGLANPEQAKNEIAAFIHDHKAEIDAGAHVGGWHDKEHNEFSLDIVDVHTNRQKAVALGKKRDQISIFHLDNFDEIQTGGTGGRSSIDTRDFASIVGQKRFVQRTDDARKSGGQTKGNFTHPVTGHNMGKSEIGDTYEHLFSAKGQQMVAEALGTNDFRMIAGVQTDKGNSSRTTALDFAFNHSHGGEVKTLSASSTNQKTAIKAAEIERKNQAVDSMGVKPLLVVQVVDQKTGIVHVYMWPAFASKAVNKMQHVGSYKYSTGDFVKAQAKTGHGAKAAARAERQASGKLTPAIPHSPSRKGDTIIETIANVPHIHTQLN